MSYRRINRVEKWDQNGPNLVFEVGKSGVKEIGEHQAMGPGDVWFYDVVMVDGVQVRVFYPDVVRYGAPITLETPQAPKIIT